MSSFNPCCPTDPRGPGRPVPDGPADHARAETAGFGVCGGLLLLSSAVTAYALLLARMFSVATAAGGLALLAVAVAQLGLPLGAAIVYLRPSWFAPAATAQRMVLSAAACGVLLAGVFLIHRQIPVSPNYKEIRSLRFAALAVAEDLLLALPLVAAGICTTLALVRHPLQTGRLYAMNLAGAAAACLAIAVLSRWIDPVTLVFDVAGIGLLAAACFLGGRGMRRLWWLSPAALVLLVGLVALNLISLTRDIPPVGLKWIKGKSAYPIVYDRWNCFSRVTVAKAESEPICWGVSSRFELRGPVGQMWLSVDSDSGMMMTEFHGDLAGLEYLRYDVVNLVHYLRPNARVLVLGSGGGRDILTALCFRQRQIVGVEVNGAILEAVHRRFGDFTGHLDQLPSVQIVHDEARSYLARNDGEPFDIIHAPLLDSRASTPGGPYLFPENSVYTVESWQRILERLSPHGIASFSYWHAPDLPARLYRLTATAIIALQRQGVARPRDYLMVVWHAAEPKADRPNAIATLLVGRSPFSPGDVEKMSRKADELGLQVLLSPRVAAEEPLARLTETGDLPSLLDNFMINITPATDDRPFFFDTIRFRDLPAMIWEPEQELDIDTDAILAQAIVLAVVFGLAGLIVFVPLAFSWRKFRPAGWLPWLVYFGGLGLGLMLAETALVQRLSLFLGHPIYMLTVVIFCLLAAAGAGSWLSGLLRPGAAIGRKPAAVVAVLAALLLLAARGALPWVSGLAGAPAAVRIALAAAMLVPLGVVMGMGFPLGLRAISSRHAPRAVRPGLQTARDEMADGTRSGADGTRSVPATLAPWLIGVHSAASVCGAVAATAVCLCLGITATWIAAAACYLVGALALLGGEGS